MNKESLKSKYIKNGGPFTPGSQYHTNHNNDLLGFDNANK
jgi:hypothetical protein